MEFVEASSGPLIWPFVVLIIAGIIMMIVCFPTATIIDEDRKVLRGLLISGGAIGIVLFVGSIIFAFILDNNQVTANNERKILIAQSMVDTYGISIEPDQVNGYYFTNSESRREFSEGLGHPNDMPTRSFVVFETVNVKSLDTDDKLVANDVTLVWVDGEMRLYGLDENNEIGSELPRVDEE